MINFFVAHGHSYTVTPFLDTWPNRVRDSFRIVSYESLALIRSLRPGTYIFSDLDRLGATQIGNVERLCEFISTYLDCSLILNRPRGLLLRRDLLQRLWEQGINRFRAFPIDVPVDQIRFPAFIRMANDHKGPVTEILRNPDEYRAALARVGPIVGAASQPVVIEFCDTRAADGLYRKFSAFRVGDRIIPAHVIRSSNWVTKNSGPEPLQDEERIYLSQNPHHDELLRIFNLARITYGRIDYGLLEGKIQVWEINTNPMLIQERDKYAPDKLALKQHLVDQLSAALLDADRLTSSHTKEKASLPPGIMHFAGWELLKHWGRVSFGQDL